MRTLPLALACALCGLTLLSCRHRDEPQPIQLVGYASEDRAAWHHPLVEDQIEPFATSQIQITPQTWGEYRNLAEVVLGALGRLRQIEVNRVTLAPFLDAASETLLTPEASPEAFAQMMYHLRRGEEEAITAEGITLVLGRIPRDPSSGLPLFTLHARLEERSPETARPAHLDMVQCVIDTGDPRLGGVEVVLQRSDLDPTIFTYDLARLDADDPSERRGVMTYAGPDNASIVESLRRDLWEPLIDERYVRLLTRYQEENEIGDLRWANARPAPVEEAPATVSTSPEAVAPAPPAAPLTPEATASPELRDVTDLFFGLQAIPAPASPEAGM